MTEKIYLETFEKRPGLLYFPLLIIIIIIIFIIIDIIISIQHINLLSPPPLSSTHQY